MTLIYFLSKILRTYSVNGLILLLLFLVSTCKDDDSTEEPEPQPVITSINPTSGPIGTEVTISGSNFSETASQNSVKFNSTNTTVKSATTNSIIVDVPDGATTGEVTVTVRSQTATGPIFTVVEEATGIEIDCSENEITSSITWENIESGDAVDYIVNCAISVTNNALLTIEPGVIIKFEGDESGIFTSDGGGLKAVGTADEPIKFLGTSENAGVWKGIYFASTNPENRLEYVEVKHAGRTESAQSGVKGAVQLSQKDDSRGSIVHCTISENDGYGVFITAESNLEDFSDNTISDNELSAVGIDFNQIGKLDSETSYASGNGQAYVDVSNATLEVDATVKLIDVAYRFTEGSKYYVEKALTIEPGVTMEFASGSGLRMGVSGTDCSLTTASLNAVGTASDPITFKGVSNGTGSWVGIGINSSSPDNKLIYCNISGAGAAKIFNAGDKFANITLQCDSKVIIQNSTISESGEYGIYVLDEDAVLDDFESNSLTDNDAAPIFMYLPHIGELDSTSTYLSGNENQYIHVSGEALTDNELTVKSLDVPYRINVSKSGRPVYVEQAITIEPGVIFEFETSSGLILGSPGVDCIPTTGSINAVGVADNPIIFRGTTEGQGTWQGIGINSSTSQNVFEFCEISGGGSEQLYNAGGQGNIVIHCDGDLKLHHSTIKDSGGWGIDFVQSANDLDLDDNTFENNTSGDISL